MASTLRDVAQLAGVSVKTVSNVVNGYPHVSPDVRRRVEAAVAELHYRPNASARTLRTGRTGVLALVLPTSDLPYAGLAGAVVHAAAQRGYRVVVAPDDQPRSSGLHDARTMPVDGVLVGAPVTPGELGPAVAATGPPVVLIGGAPHDQRCDRVSIDVAQAAEDATDHLLRAGRRRIAAIGDRPAASPQPGTAGYHRALRRAGLVPVPGGLLSARHHRRADGYRAARDLLVGPDHPDAILCSSDPLAIGAMRAAFDVGLRVPDDVAVIGIGDIEEGRYSRPTLSTVAVDTGFLAREAVARLTVRIGQPDAAVADIVAPHTVLPRESTDATAR
ncbi:LacI family transcriptional regulator [Micromonospora sp. LAH09]|uniref:LacI family DNA-binding transcriptional regulator n=1 Tax=Micromonospora cabrerizensis TaxID=2911213 RepID=UPI001EE7D965|nr:LacI family DNA-binding transcriptional regulator [Micromonospora cabrerizensis]MCG5469523.1 LacI family transcriptional regulator [Micromonospora cabrerizensis]